MHNVILIGAGQLGSRHLQGLSRSSLSLHIDVVDSSKPSLRTAKSRYEEMPKGNTRAEYHAAIPTGKTYDLAIIATSSLPRAAVTKTLLTACEVKYILFEKVLFPSEEDYASIGALLEQRGVAAWVNCPRRMYAYLNEIKPLLGGHIHVCMQGGMWGIGANSIHIIDLAAWLGDESEFSCDPTMLDPVIHQSKRAGYAEFSGLLLAKGRNGTTVSMYACRESAAPTTLHIFGDTLRADLDEERGAGALYRRESAWKQELFTIRTPFQSELSHIVADSILTTGSCALPGYALSAALHIPMIQAFHRHITRLGYDVAEFPVT